MAALIRPRLIAVLAGLAGAGCTPAAILAPSPAPGANAATAAADEVCSNRTGQTGAYFYTFWKNGGEACMDLLGGGRYAARYRLGRGENLVAGLGWRTGSESRSVGYRAAAFEAGTNSYLTLYGWSVDPLVEYYVIDDWGSAFTPPGPGAAPLGTVESDGGTYRIYRTLRVRQPSIRGTATFAQYWSVRTERRPLGADNRISFANHVAAWHRHGLRLGRMDYQVMATEGFGSNGASDISVWQWQAEP